MPCPPPPPYLPGLPPPPPPPTQGFLPGGLVPLGEGGQQVRPLPSTGRADLGLSESALHAFVAALQGVVAAGVSAELRQNLENRGEPLVKFWSSGTRGGGHMPRPPPPPYPPGRPPPPTPPTQGFPSGGVGPTGGRGAAGINPEENQYHPEDITYRLDDLSYHAPPSRPNFGSSRGGATNPLSGTSCPETMSGTSCLDPEDNQDQPKDITSYLDDFSGHAPSSRLD